LFLYPLNNDGAGHLGYIEYIVENGTLPANGITHQTYHPPLYYLTAAPILLVSRNLKLVVQLLSLVLPVGTLLLLYLLIYRGGAIGSQKAKHYSFAIVALLPQFIMFGLYISNDSLAIFLGTATAWQIRHYLERLDLDNAAWLGALIPESNFIGNWYAPSMYLGSIIYVLAAIPTAVLLIGLLRIPFIVKAFWSGSIYPLDGRRADFVFAVVLIFIANVCVLILAGIN
jgi:hypothetical protein